MTCLARCAAAVPVADDDASCAVAGEDEEEEEGVLLGETSVIEVLVRAEKPILVYCFGYSRGSDCRVPPAVAIL